jgi:hypothetical protein
MNKHNLTIGLILVLMLSLSLACSVNINNTDLEIRTDRENVYSSSISAEDDDEVDIKVSFDITNISGTGCASNVDVKSKIYRWDETNNEWDLDRTTSTQYNALATNPFLFTWDDALTINDNYPRYKIEAIIQEGSNDLDILQAYIDVEDNTCSGIELIASNFTLDEGEDQTKTFRIENNTNSDFDVDNVQLLFTTSIVSSGSVDYPEQVDNYSTENVTVNLDPGYVSYDKTATGTFAVSGTLNGTYCSSTAIGKKTFEVTVRNTGSNNNNNNSSDGKCDDLTIHTKNITVKEGAETKEIFYIKNDSTKRFEVLDVDTTENGLDLRGYYFEKYAFPGDIADIVIQAIAPNVTSNKTYENILEVKGRFSDGTTCDFDDITQGNYDVYITNTSAETNIDCGDITIDVPNEVKVANAATIPFSIRNNSNTRVDVFVESTLTVDPTLISLPARTSMDRDLFVSIDASEGQIYLRAQSACPVENKTIRVINTVSGSLEQVSMTSEIVNDNNLYILRINFDNPTDKAFKGVLSLDIDGLAIDDKIVTVAPGQSTVDIPLDSNKEINGNISFVSNDQELTSQINSGSNDQDKGLLAGFFGLGLESAGIAIILILIIIAVVLIVTLYEGTRYEEENQEFVRTKQ